MNKNNITATNAKHKNGLPEGIRQKDNGTFSFRVNVKDTQGERKRFEMAGFETAKEAQTAKMIIQAEFNKNLVILAEKECKMTVTELYNEFISKEARFDRKKSTLARYASLQRNHVDPKWGNRGIKDVKPQEVTDYLFELTQTHSNNYIMSLQKYIKVLFKYAVKNEYMSMNPIEKVIAPMKRVEYEESEVKVYTQEQLDKFEERFSKTNVLTAYKIGRALGVRSAECFGLLWSDIDWEKHTIKINKQLVCEDKMWTLRRLNTYSSLREIELQNSIYNYLKELKVTQEQQKAEAGIAYKETRVADCTGRNNNKEIVTNLDFINIKPNGELLTPDNIRVLNRIARVELGINFKFHNLRHTHASELAIMGVDVLAAKVRLGHTSVQATMKYYTYVSSLGVKDALDLVDKGGIV